SSSSHTLPLNHPSLAAARVILNKKGALLERRSTLSPRVAKSLPFLTPRFPPGASRRGQTWEEPVEWIDVYNDWKFHWAATLHWTLGELEPCGDNACARLTYQADLRPQLWAAPSWAAPGVKRAAAQVSLTNGVALFDVRHKRIVSNVFSYDGTLTL